MLRQASVLGQVITTYMRMPDISLEERQLYCTTPMQCSHSCYEGNELGITLMGDW